MPARTDRIARAQTLMAAHGIDALLILTHDDYTYFFGEDRYQPRAIIPATGQPMVVAFSAEADDIRRRFAVDDVLVFGSVGQQMKEVITVMRGLQARKGGNPVIGIQLSWFEVPAALVGMFQKANPRVEVVDSGPVMDELRFVKEADELAAMRVAAEVAGVGMRAALASIRPGIRELDVAAEMEYAMRKAGATGTGVPTFVNSGERTLWLHGTATERVIQPGELVVLDVVPRCQGYLSNLARTAVVGEPTADQQRLFDAYVAAQQAAIAAIRPGAKMADIDAAAQAQLAARGLAEYHVPGISHGLGLRFEETPAPTIHFKHGSFVLREGMVVTAGHPVLAAPGIGGVRVEDVGRVGPAGWEPITEFPTALFRVG